MGKALKELFQTPYFRVVAVPDEETVELCGALKVSCGPPYMIELCGALKVSCGPPCMLSCVVL